MHKLWKRPPSPAMVVAMIALVAALAGTAVAAPQIAGTAKKHSKPLTRKQTIALIKKYAPRFVKVKTGATGPPGATGQTGATGPSAAFSVTRADGPTGIAQSTDTTIATLAGLPAGSYVITAKTQVTMNGASGTTDMSCSLHAGSDSDQADGFIGTLSNAGEVFEEQMPMQLTHTFSTSGTTSVSCLKSGTAAIGFSHTSIVAELVGSQSSAAVGG